jgi:hypothetical protein
MDKIVLVLGAGASRELGFPTGWELMDRILREISLNDRYEFGNGQGQFSDLVNQFLTVSGKRTETREDQVRNLAFFKQSLLPIRSAMEAWMNRGKGLDAFLNQNGEDGLPKQFGKFAISYYIMGQEEWLMRENLYAFNRNWLRELLERHFQPMKEEVRKGEIKVKLIIFNYDRVVEHFFYNFLRHAPAPVIPGFDNRLMTDESKDIVDSFGNLHVYNKIADLEWQNRAGKSIRFGERNNDRPGLQAASETVRLVAEPGLGRVSDQMINEIRSIMSEADRIYFLGFGFDPDNMGILFGPSPTISKSDGRPIMHATAVSLPTQLQEQYPFINFHKDMSCFEMISDASLFSIA